MLCYSDSVSTGAAGFDPMKCNAVKCYMEHYHNSLYLTFMLQNGSTIEKHEASKEMEICERKMKYWQNQPHFIESEADRQRIEAKRKWA